MSKGKKKRTKPVQANEGQISPEFFIDIRSMIEDTQRRIAVTVNVHRTMLYWSVGKRIREEVLKHDRAEYGKEVVKHLSKYLIREFGGGWSSASVHRMVQFYDTFQDETIVAALRRQLSWTHIKRIIAIKDPLQRDFYIELCKQESWSVRMLEKKIKSMLFERTEVAMKPELQIRHELNQMRETGEITEDFVFRSPLLLDFLSLGEKYSEKKLESAILQEMHHFLVELGSGFTFIESQKHMEIDGKHYYLDLLFYHRKLKRLICNDLKLEDFKASFKGQMELYLQWLHKNDNQGEASPPIGIILCTGKKQQCEQIQLLELRDARIHVAEYLIELPSKEEFKEQLRIAIERSRKYTHPQK